MTLQVNKANNLSPGRFTTKFNLIRERQYKKRRERECTREYKKRRVLIKKLRLKDRQHKEVLEGPTYKSGVQYVPPTYKDDLTPIPKPFGPPISSPVGLHVSKQDSRLIVFDLETSNLGKSNILQ